MLGRRKLMVGWEGEGEESLKDPEEWGIKRGKNRMAKRKVCVGIEGADWLKEGRVKKGLKAFKDER